MALSKAFLVTVAMVLAVAAPVVMAKDIMVGDENGWKLNFDYIAWAKTQEFHVGDRLSMLFFFHFFLFVTFYLIIIFFAY